MLINPLINRPLTVMQAPVLWLTEFFRPHIRAFHLVCFLESVVTGEFRDYPANSYQKMSLLLQIIPHVQIHLLPMQRLTIILR